MKLIITDTNKTALKPGTEATATVDLDGDFEACFEIRVHESHAFKYGNGTCVTVKEVTRTYSESNEYVESYDTRYYHGSFEDLIVDLLDEMFGRYEGNVTYNIEVK